MKVRHCSITAYVTLMYRTRREDGTIEQHVPIYFDVVQGDDIINVLKNEIRKRTDMMTLDNIYLGYQLQSLKIDAIKNAVTCRGCLDDQPNQEAHAQHPGDCLYDAPSQHNQDGL